jgi:hypothetical protein
MSAEWRRWLAVGTGVGIEIAGDDLAVTVARIRPSGVEVVAAARISFRGRRASEWGSEYSAFLKRAGASHLAAAVLLPRSELTVRHLSLPGVAAKDLAAAISFQLDSLHTYPEEDVAFTWSKIGSAGTVLLGITRRQVIEHYSSLFSEAGVKVGSLTFSAAVLYCALRLLSQPPSDGLLAFREFDGGLEIYGESPARPVFSAVFHVNPERARALAASELRLSPDVTPAALQQVLPQARGAVDEVSALSYATALAAACPWLALNANLLPVEQRTTSSRMIYAPTVALAAILLLMVAALGAQSAYQNRRYLGLIESEIARFEPAARKVSSLDSQIAAARSRIGQIDEFRSRSKADLDAMLELTNLLAPPVWLEGLELSRAGAQIYGQADQSDRLLKILDNSPLFSGSEFAMPTTRTQGGEIFRIRAQREGAPR